MEFKITHFHAANIHTCRAYFSVNLLNVVAELLDVSKEDTALIIGCDTLTAFIHCQVIYLPKLRIHILSMKDEVGSLLYMVLVISASQ